MKNNIKYNLTIIVFLITFSLLSLNASQSFAQSLSNKPEEFIIQLDQIMTGSRLEPVMQASSNFKSAWDSKRFNEKQQQSLMFSIRKIVDKRLRVAGELTTFLNTVTAALEQKGATDEIVSVTEKAFTIYSPAQMIDYINTLHSFVVKSQLYGSIYGRVHAFGNDYQLVFVDTLTNRKAGWWADWAEADITDKDGNVNPYPFARVEGAAILVNKTSLCWANQSDSITLENTKGAYIFDRKVFVGNKGHFEWDNINLRTPTNDSPDAKTMPKIFADFEKYSFIPEEQKLSAENVTLTYEKKITKPAKGSFKYVAEARKNTKDTRFPQFRSYAENAEIENVGNETHKLHYQGGFSVRGWKLYGTSSKNMATIDLVQEGQKKFQTRSNEFYLGDDEITANDASFSFYISGQDSLSHSDVTLHYSLSKVAGDSMPDHVFKLFKEKTHHEIPFIDNYHKMYIMADMAIYNSAKNNMDFYMLGGGGKSPALFESYSYYSDVRYEDMQGLNNYHPLQLLESVAKKYGTRNAQGDMVFQLDAAADVYKKDMKILTAQVRALSQEGYVRYDESKNEVIILNRTSHNDASYFYKIAMERKKDYPKKKLPKGLQEYADHDFDDMVIESLAPREASKDSSKSDTVKFKFARETMYFGKLESKSIVITKRAFRAIPDSILRDTTITFGDTLIIKNFVLNKKIIIQEEFERLKYNPKQYIMTEIEGYFINTKRSKGKVMPNASVDANGGGMLIRGIEAFSISKKLNVNILPREKEIRIFENRSILMEHGEVTVGNFRFIGRNFVLPYDEFKLTMGEIDTVLFSVPDKDNPKKRIDLGAEIRMNDGSLQINNPNNKSGLKTGLIAGAEKKGDTYEMYPKLSVETGGKIYFDQFYRQKSAYHKPQAYFEIPKLELDSLTSSAPKFTGTFYSNMLPPIKEDLIPIFDANYNGIEEKYSLGFVHRPKKPIKLYATDGTITADSLVMYKTSLTASGRNTEIKHLTYSVKANKIVLTPDSAFAYNAELNAKQGRVKNTDYPHAFGKNLKLHWSTGYRKDTLFVPQDSLVVSNKVNEPMTVFNADNPAAANGKIAITPRALWLTGMLVRKDFFMFAPEGMTITNDRIFTPNTADNAVDFKINSLNADPFDTTSANLYIEHPPIIQGNAVAVDFDLKRGIAKITPNDTIAKSDPTYAFITFPYAKFKTSIKQATWDVNKKMITMKGDSSSVFYSTKFQEETGSNAKDLEFISTGGTYDIKDLENPILELTGVPYIISADSRILPDKGKIEILKGSEVQELRNAKLVIDTLNKYHKLIDGTIKIHNRLEYEGDATYQYTNVDSSKTNIKFDKFEFIRELRVDSSKRKRRRDLPDSVAYTRGNGEVADTERFFVTKSILFKGKVEMLAFKKDLKVDGYIKAELAKHKEFNSTWIPYKRDAGDVYIELEEKTQGEADVVTSGLHFNKDEGKIYPTFLSIKPNQSDDDIFLAKGVLKYLPKEDEFKITDKKKLDSTQTNYEGNVFVFDDKKDFMQMEGAINLTDAETQKYIRTAGNAKVNIAKHKYDINTMMVFDFKNPKIAFTTAGQLFKINRPSDAENAINDSLPIQPKMAEFIGNEKTLSYEKDRKGIYKPLFMADKKLKKSLVLSNVHFKWSDSTKAFYSVGKIGVASMYDRDVNAMLNGFVEIKKTAGGDIVSVYLEAGEGNWLYFNTEGGILKGSGSQNAILKAFAKGKPSKKAGELSVSAAEEGAETEFRRAFKKNYILNGATDPEEAKEEQERKEREKKEEEEKLEQEKKEKEEEKKEKEENPDAEETEIPANETPLQKKKREKDAKAKKAKLEKEEKAKLAKEAKDKKKNKDKPKEEIEEEEEKKEEEEEKEEKPKDKPKEEKPKEEKPKEKEKPKVDEEKEEEEEEPVIETPAQKKKREVAEKIQKAKEAKEEKARLAKEAKDKKNKPKEEPKEEEKPKEEKPKDKPKEEEKPKDKPKEEKPKDKPKEEKKKEEPKEEEEEKEEENLDPKAKAKAEKDKKDKAEKAKKEAEKKKKEEEKKKKDKKEGKKDEKPKEEEKEDEGGF